MKILSLSCVFPNPNEPGLGTFVRARLQAMSSHARITILGPIPAIDYSRMRGRCNPIPKQRVDGVLEVLHPRWFYLPGGAALNAACLAVRLLPMTTIIRKQYRFDWIDSHFAFPDGIAAAMLAQWFNVPFSITLRGNETMHASRSKAIRKLMQWAFQRAACIVSVSESLRQFAISMGADPETTRTIPNGVDGQIFYPRNRTACREKLGFAQSCKIVVSAGSLIERKGHHRVMRALSLLANQDDTHLVIVGGPGREGDFSAKLHRLPGELGIADRVHFLGQVTPECMAEVMSAADLFCLASSREGWPNVVHEAMACGCPIVCTDVGGTPDMVPSHRYGTVVPTDDEAALQSAVDAALRTTWDHDAIREWAHSRSWEKVANEVLELLRDSQPKPGNA